MKRNMRFFFVPLLGLALITSIIVASNGQARSAVLAIVTCATTTACTGGTNSSTGPGVQGQSAKGHGVVGNTTFTSTNNTNGESAVFGQDLSRSGVYNMGVQGVSVSGYGVRGKSTSGIGVRGDSTNSYGLEGMSSNGVAVFGQSSYTGVYGIGTTYGSYGLANNGYGTVGVGSIGLYGSGTTYGLYAITGSGNGVFAQSGSGQAVYAQSSSTRSFEGHSNSGTSLFITEKTGNGGDITGSYIGLVARSNTFPLDLTDTSGNPLFYVDGSGNVFHKGSLNTISGRPGSTIVTTSTQATSPSIEETGTARLAFGQANVYLSPSFAHSINASRGYQVFLTPGGETRGLYVANKYTGGFTVREMYSGRSNITFDYHVYASTGSAPEAAALSSTNAPRAMPLQPAIVNPIAAPRPPAVQRPNE